MYKGQSCLPLNGDEAVAFAVKQVEPDVVAAYPITPQTIIVEKLSEYVNNGDIITEFVAVESEHSALSACIGASATGARAFTATSSQGLALMWEVLYVASGLRLPIVMAVANRALSSPINIHCDHSDVMGARDSGWIQVFCRNSQEAYDMSVCAWRIAEHESVQLPVMVNLDGFIVSHTMENVSTLPDFTVKQFVGKRNLIDVISHRGNKAPYKLDPENPLTLGALDLYDYFFEHKMQVLDAIHKACNVAEEVFTEFSKISRREYHPVEPYKAEDAEIVVVGLGSIMDTVTVAVDELRKQGYKVGAINLRLFRPFPSDELAKLVKGANIVITMDRAVSPGSLGPPLFTEVRNVLFDLSDKPAVVGHIYGLGGRDLAVHQIRDIVIDSSKRLKDSNIILPIRYVGVREA